MGTTAAESARSPRKTWLAHVPAVLLWTMAAWFLVEEFVVGPLTTPGIDFRKHWLASNLVLAGESPYIGENGINYLGFNYPMFTALIYLPLAAFGVATAETVWDTMNLVYVVVATFMLAFMTRPPLETNDDFPPIWNRVLAFLHANWIPLVVCFVLSFKPLHKGISAGNVDPLNLLLGTSFALATIRRKDRLAGVLLALFCLVKIAPVFLVVPLVAMRRWKLLGAFLATLSVYGIVLLIGGWWRWELFLVTDVVPKLPFRWQSLSISIHRFAASVIQPEALDDGHLYKRYVLGINMVLLPLFAAMCAWWWKRGRGDEELFLAFGFLLLLLLSPLVEVIHFIWVVPAVVLHLRGMVRGRLGPLVSFACMASWLGTHWLDILPWLPGLKNRFPYEWWVQTFVLLALIACSGIAAFRVREPAPPPAPRDTPSPTPTGS